jgi:mannose/fructose-specific phosphotransferase system component IIA
MIRGIIIGHGDFAKSIVHTAEQVVGKQKYVDIISNVGCSGKALNDKIQEALNRNKKYEAIIFVDLPGGSCTISCYNLLRDDPNLHIICGLNLPIMIEFFVLRNKHTAQELIPILIKKGKENIFQLRSTS